MSRTYDFPNFPTPLVVKEKDLQGFQNLAGLPSLNIGSYRIIPRPE